MEDGGPEGSEMLATIADQFDKRELDAVCGFALAAGDRANGGVLSELILFRPRDGEDSIPHERSTSMLRGLAKSLRVMADDLESIASEMDRQLEAAGGPMN